LTNFLVNSFIEFPAPIVVDDTGLIAYYKFDESSGVLLNKSVSDDTLGTNANGSIIDASTYSQTGVIDTAIKTPGGYDEAAFQLGTSVSQWNFFHNGGSWTVCFWMKLATSEPNTFSEILTERPGAQGASIGVDIYMEDRTGSGDHDFRVSLSNGTNNLSITSSGSYIPKNTTTFYFYTVTYTAASDTIDIYRDNANNESNSASWTHTSSNSTHTMRLGGYGSGAGVNGMHATFDEMSIWNRVLTSDQISELYNGGSGLAIYSD